MLPPNLDSLNLKHLDQLIADEAQESRSLEFKASLNVGSDSEKKEFLADVSSFANAGGGDIIFGIEENEGAASSICGIEGFDQDSGHLRIEEIIRNGIEPRIVGLQLRSLVLESGNSILVIRIPSSFNRPHMVTYKGGSKFYSRNSAGKYPLDITEIRAAFIASESLSNKLRDFKAERIDNIIRGNTPEKLLGSHLMCLHLIPLESFNTSYNFDLSSAQTLQDHLRPVNSRGWGPGINFDGFYMVSHTSHDNERVATSYVQLFRNGTLEAVESLMFQVSENNQKIIPKIAYERELISALDRFLTFYRQYDMPTPIVVTLSFLNVKGFTMYVDPGNWNHSARAIDREHLILPEQFIDSYEVSAANILKRLFDQVLNACGWARDLNYDVDGNWVNRG